MLSAERQLNTNLLGSSPFSGECCSDAKVQENRVRPFQRHDHSPNGASLFNRESYPLSSPVPSIPRIAPAPVFAAMSGGQDCTPTISKPLTDTTITEISTRGEILERFDTHIERLKALRKKVHSSDIEPIKPIQPDMSHVKGKNASFPTFLLTGTLAYLDRLANPPLLPARLADIFERDFRRVEPMFHTVFYRKYHPAVLADAKQEALLGLYKKWLKNRYLLDQSAAYIVTAGIYSVSNWRQKSQDIRANEGVLAVDNQGKVIGQRSENGVHRGTDHIDFHIDLEDAVDVILRKHEREDDYATTYSVMRDILDEVRFTDGQKILNLKRGQYMRRKDLLKAELRELLNVYRVHSEVP